MAMNPFNLNHVDRSWQTCLINSLEKIDPAYLKQLQQSSDWLPGPDKIFNAFSLPVNRVNYVLFGESPYPRQASANGYAFWDEAVKDLWSETGLSKPVNRATSMRNLLKMLLIAEGMLDPQETTQEAIARIDKQCLVKTGSEFFTNLLDHGFLLLNATPVLQAAGAPQKDARTWKPFIKEILQYLLTQRPQTRMILFGRIANEIDSLLPTTGVEKLYAEHPYNVSFITQKKVQDFFRPLHLLRAQQIKVQPQAVESM